VILIIEDKLRRVKSLHGEERKIYVYNLLVIKSTERSPLGMEQVNESSWYNELVSSHGPKTLSRNERTISIVIAKLLQKICDTT
jgi:hypothetical protein